MAVKMATLPEPESGTKRPKPTIPKNDAFAMVLIRKCETPTTIISQENGHGILKITCQFVAYK